MEKNNVHSRTQNAILNSLVGILSSLVTIFLNFIVRIVIVRELGAEINGLHNLFTSITNVVTLIEAGFSTAMVIFLYKPIKEEKQDEIRAVMAFYRKIYQIIAIATLVIGIVVDVFLLPVLVHSMLPMWKVRAYYFIYMLITPFQFLTYYKISILYAEQNNRVYALAMTVSQIVFRTLQIVSVFITHEYYVFVALLILEKLACNFYCSYNVDKRHTYLKKKSAPELPEAEKKKIFQMVKPIFISNVAANIQGSSQSILISLLLGNVSIVGYFGNYQLITSTARQLFSQFGVALTSGFGNLAVEGDKDHMYAVYKKTCFILDWISILLCGGFICCVQSFVYMCFGQEFLLTRPDVILLTIELYVYLLGIPVICVQNAMGLHRKDQNVMVLQAIFAIVLAYILGKNIGMAGILLGLLIPQFLFTLLNKGIVIHRYAFARGAKDFLPFIFVELVKGFFVVGCSVWATSWVNTGILFLDFLLQGGLAVLITMVLFFVMSFRNPYFRDSLDLIQSIVKKKC